MNGSLQLIVFTLNEQRYALYLSVVERVVRIVRVTPLPKAPEIVFGVINVEGRIIPVLDTRKRFRLPERGLDLNDRLIIARTSGRVVALIVDKVTGVLQLLENDLVAVEKILPGLEYVEGVLKLEDGLVLIHDLDRFLSLDEETTLEGALRPAT
jgi:purine-binding chemotaxis protein CheW